MENREIGRLEKVELTAIWDDEPTFTRWLSKHLHYLQPVVNVELQLIQPEHQMHRAGRVDILAQDVKSDTAVVIENQFGEADNDHFARLAGYAASREARFLIWISPEFSKWHLDIMLWLNAAGIEIFGIQVSAYRIGNAYAPLFELVAGPEDSASVADTRAAGGPNIYSRFYRPLVRSLREEGIRAMSARNHGFVARYRRYRSKALLEDAGITYYSQLQWGEKNCRVGLIFSGEDSSKICDVMYESRNELDGHLDGLNIQWQRSEYESYIWTDTAGIPDEEDETLEARRLWMKDTLLKLRNTFEPKLEDIIANFPPSDIRLQEDQGS